MRRGVRIFGGERSREIQQVHPEMPRPKQDVFVERKRDASETKNTRGARVQSTSSRMMRPGVFMIVLSVLLHSRYSSTVLMHSGSIRVVL